MRNHVKSEVDAFIALPRAEKARVIKGIEAETPSKRLVRSRLLNAEERRRWRRFQDKVERAAKAAVLKIIGRSLMQRRMKAGLSKEELARKAGVRSETISRIESGRFRPRRETMARLDGALGGEVKVRQRVWESSCM
ncbi:MAG TPA: helix-turn-helix transcriptional regulator [Tepidisphaeraceae bacterium]|nr:helix-turn-helix transcriptional regulator [Tepidisphaeraceae bacterium]